MDRNQIINVNELYPCIQGEGKYAGVPHILIRMTGCALRCQFKGSFCDTWYSSWRPEKGKFTLKDIAQICRNNPQISHALVTGGGPTQSPSNLIDIVGVLKEEGMFVTIETEGSQYVPTEADFISLSPKLSNSTPKVGSTLFIGPDDTIEVTQKHVDRHEARRGNYDAMNTFITRHDYQLKFVVSSEEDIEEIRQTIYAIENVNQRQVYLMPEGTTTKEIGLHRREIMEACIKEGWNYTDRLHILAYEDRRGV